MLRVCIKVFAFTFSYDNVIALRFLLYSHNIEFITN